MIYNQRYFRNILLVLCLVAATAGRAQTMKNITVSQGKSYTDHISLKDDSRDMDLMAKFIFNEQTNTLNVCLISYRDLFVFPTDVPMKKTISGKRIKPDKLPFVVNSESGVKYILTKDYLKTLPKNRKKAIFHQWATAEGLQPIPKEYKMVNDFVSQDFSIMNKADAVTITLRDVLMLEKKENGKPNKVEYDVVWGKDLNTTYRIYIERNPCFGMEEQIAAAQKALDAITAAFHNLQERFGSGVVSTAASLANFKEMKELLVGQYPRKTEQSPCPDIQQKQDAYNSVLDSITSMRCRMINAASYMGGAGGAVGKGGAPREGVDAGFILTQARLIDDAVSQWVLSKDMAQKADLKKKCQEIVSTVKTAVAQKGLINESQRRAYSHFNEAVAYYRSTCK